MKKKDYRLGTIDFRFSAVLLGLLSLVYCPSFVFAEDWLEGASGYARGLEQSKASGQPMISMFYTDWCPYCQKLQKNVLAKPEVKKALSQFVKVRINPEKGSNENQLAEQYGVQGYPAVYLERPASSGQPEELGSAIRSAGAFIAALKKFESKEGKQGA